MKRKLIIGLMVMIMSICSGNAFGGSNNVEVVCIEGYKYVILKSKVREMPVDIEQMFRQSNIKYNEKNPPQPIKCEEDK